MTYLPAKKTRFLNSNQKKAIMHLSVAGALLLGNKEGVFKLKYPFLKYYLERTDEVLTFLLSLLPKKELKKILKTISNTDTERNNDEFYNILYAYLAINWCMENAFNTENHLAIQKILKQTASRLKGYLKKIKDNYEKEYIADLLTKFYFIF